MIERVWLKALRLWWQCTVPIRLRLAGVTLRGRPIFYGMPVVSVAPGSKIEIGDGVTICSDSRFTALGVNHKCVLRTLRPGAQILIGAGTGISGGSICAASSVVLGQNCLVGANVTIVDTDFHAIRPEGRRINNSWTDIGMRPVVVEDNVFLGTASILLKGTYIGKNAVVAAAAVVSGRIEADVIAAGLPARAIRRIG